MKSTMWVKRVTLLNGIPTGKGRPGRDEKKVRTCVYIPLKESFGSHTRATAEKPYNPSKNESQRRQFKRTNISNLIVVAASTPAVADSTPAVETVAVNEAPAVEATPVVETPAETATIDTLAEAVVQMA